MHSRARAIVASCVRSSSNSSNTLRCNFHTRTIYSGSSRSSCSSGTTGGSIGSRQREECNSGAAAVCVAADEWRGTEKQQQHYRRRLLLQQQIINKEQKLLSAAAARWQHFWHQENPHAPRPSNVVCTSINSNEGNSSSSSDDNSSSNNSSSSSRDVVHVVLINLGSPSRPTYTAVWKYLRQFLSDRRVIELPRVFWLPLLHLVILPIRSLISAKRYSSIWLSSEDVKERLSAAAATLQQRQQQQQQQQQQQKPSLLKQQVDGVLRGGAAPPLLVHLLSLAARLQQHLDQRQQQQQESLPRFEVSACVRYGDPSIADCLQHLQQQHRQLKLLLLPLYPQPTASCTGSAFDAVFRELNKWRLVAAVTAGSAAALAAVAAAAAPAVAAAAPTSAFDVAVAFAVAVAAAAAAVGRTVIHGKTAGVAAASLTFPVLLFLAAPQLDCLTLSLQQQQQHDEQVMPDLRMVGGYWNNVVYIHSIASSIEKFWQQHGLGNMRSLCSLGQDALNGLNPISYP
ncbi:ferrochelatase, putative [Eimeria praecox]|uniref:Ferrochelatase, putative n=1 Tax=Eimeria praecox TaxID=51316 RepID=U6H7S5_9EIME|nr:ferrochelatase, putative [Eimeria praecox]